MSFHQLGILRPPHSAQPRHGPHAAFTRAMSLKVRLAGKRKPEGWAMIEPTLVEFEERLREAVNDPRFVFDLRRGRTPGPRIRARTRAYIAGRDSA